MFDFDRSYYRALHTLIPQFQLQRVLSKDEWQEYLNYLRSVNGEEGPSDEERRIDLQGTAHTLVHPKVGTVTVYEVEGRMLYPAYDCAKLLGRQNPSVLGSQCRHKERWQVKMQRCFLADGTPSYQIMDKNFIPAEDVRKLARSSPRPEATEVCDWILSLENTKKE